MKQQPFSKPKNYHFGIKHNPKVSIQSSIVFDAWEQKIKSHPVIFFKSYDDDYYYYLSARSAYEEDYKTKKLVLRKPFPGEVLVSPKTNKANLNDLFKDYSYVDTSQIFVIHQDDLNAKIDAKQISWAHQAFDNDEIDLIFNLMLTNCIFKHLALSEIIYNQEQDDYQSEVVFCAEEISNRNYHKIAKKWDTTSIQEHLDKIAFSTSYQQGALQILEDVIYSVTENSHIELWEKEKMLAEYNYSLLRNFPPISRSKPFQSRHINK